MELNVMSYNIASGHDFRGFREGIPYPQHVDASLAAEVMKKYAPDIIGVNEVRGEGPDPDYAEQTRIMADVLGYHSFFGPAIHFPGGPYGNALLSRFPILRAEIVMIPDPADHTGDKPGDYYETRDIIRAELDVPGGLTVFVSHFGLANSEKRSAVATLLQELGHTSGRVLFMGDLNMTRDNPILAPVFSALHDTAEDAAESLLTWSSYAPERKIDYIFTSHGIRCARLQAPPETVSDHRPLLASLEL